MKNLKEMSMESLFSEKEKNRLENIKKRADDLGVWGISLVNASASTAECYESVLDIIEEDRHIIDTNAGETGDQRC